MFDISDYYNSCKNIILSLLNDKNIKLSNEKLDIIIRDILNITYAIGGGFDDSTLRAIASSILFGKDEIKKYLD